MSDDETPNDPAASGLLISKKRFPRAQDHGIFNLYPTQRNSGKAPNPDDKKPQASDPK